MPIAKYTLFSPIFLEVIMNYLIIIYQSLRRHNTLFKMVEEVKPLLSFAQLVCKQTRLNSFFVS